MAIAVGQRAVQEFAVDDRTIELFGDASTDRNPLHFDDEFGRATPFGGRIAHGMISAAFISANSRSNHSRSALGTWSVLMPARVGWIESVNDLPRVSMKVALPLSGTAMRSGGFGQVVIASSQGSCPREKARDPE